MSVVISLAIIIASVLSIVTLSFLSAYSSSLSRRRLYWRHWALICVVESHYQHVLSALECKKCRNGWTPYWLVSACSLCSSGFDSFLFCWKAVSEDDLVSSSLRRLLPNAMRPKTRNSGGSDMSIFAIIWLSSPVKYGIDWELRNEKQSEKKLLWIVRGEKV